MYLSPDEVFTDFNNTEALFWYHRDLVYGDWTIGEDGDGCYEHHKEMEIPEVRMTGRCNMKVRHLKREVTDRIVRQIWFWFKI